MDGRQTSSGTSDCIAVERLQRGGRVISKPTIDPDDSLLSNSACAECGFLPVVGELGCEGLRDALLARDFEEPLRFWRFHRMAVDAYCLQHSAYVASAKSLAAHLCGLCIAFEHANDAEMLRQLQRWLSGNPKIEKPVLPSFRGAMTIGDVCGIDDPEVFGEAVRAWAMSAWEAYGDLQPLARRWLVMSGCD